LQIDLEGIEKHAAADQAKYSVMETGRGKSIKPSPGIRCLDSSSLRDFCPDNSSSCWTLGGPQFAWDKRGSKTPIVNSYGGRDDLIVSLSEQICATFAARTTSRQLNLAGR
jgi:hypothetical protein